MVGKFNRGQVFYELSFADSDLAVPVVTTFIYLGDQGLASSEDDRLFYVCGGVGNVDDHHNIVSFTDAQSRDLICFDELVAKLSRLQIVEFNFEQFLRCKGM